MTLPKFLQFAITFAWSTRIPSAQVAEHCIPFSKSDREHPFIVLPYAPRQDSDGTCISVMNWKSCREIAEVAEVVEAMLNSCASRISHRRDCGSPPISNRGEETLDFLWQDGID